MKECLLSTQQLLVQCAKDKKKEKRKMQRALVFYMARVSKIEYLWMWYF